MRQPRLIGGGVSPGLGSKVREKATTEGTSQSYLPSLRAGATGRVREKSW